MSTAKVNKPARGESLLSVEPELLQQVDPGWRHRMSLYTGRALTDTVLTAEQQYRSGRITLLSQLVTPGVGSGLDASIDTDGTIHVAAGYGFASTGEDVTLPRELVAPALDALQVVDARTGLPLGRFGDVKNQTSQMGRVYVLMLLPVTGKATVTSGGCVEVTGEMVSSSTRDPDEYAFEDWELVDGAQLALAAWPDDKALVLPPPAPTGTWQNRIAYAVFNAELGPDPDDGTGTTAYSLPWEAIGVAIGLVAFNSDWTMVFLDRNAVVRSGGRAGHPQLQIAAPGVPGNFIGVSQAAAEARLLQLMEQNARIQSQADLAAYVNLPPTAILPAACVDLQHVLNAWFPRSWSVQAAPIHAEEIETALRTQMFARPFDLTQPEEADVLVPLTDDFYDPDVLITEVLAQEFIDERQKALDALSAALQHRKFLQNEASTLLVAEGQPPIDIDAGLSADEITARDAAVYAPPVAGTETYGTATDGGGKLFSTDIAGLLTTAATMVTDRNQKPIPLFNSVDLQTLNAQGLPAFIDLINARLDKVDDLINLNFLQTQTNIYRYRTNVLKGTDASRLVTSPIIAAIADRESATATAQDLSAYIASITPAATGALKLSVADAAPAAAAAPVVPAADTHPLNLRLSTIGVVSAGTTLAGSVASKSILIGAGTKNLGGLEVTPRVTPVQASETLNFSSSVIAAIQGSASAGRDAISQLPSQAVTTTPTEVAAQLPMEGVPFNIRTLNIAERLKTSPSHEALLYSLSTRTGFLDTLLDSQFATDFGISIDDLEILVQEQDNTGKFTLKSYSIADVRTNRSAIYASIQMAGLPTDADESAVFSGGITSLDHHTLLLRAVEARVSLYRRFLDLATTALTNIQGQVQSLQAAIKRLENDLAEARGNLSLVLGLINDENVRIDTVNTRREATRASVSFVVLRRRETLETDADVPSRQLVPANVASPVPAALRSSAIIPPELRELSALLREAPLAWMPATEALLAQLERQQHFATIALQMRVRAIGRLQMPLALSSATSHPGPYGLPLADIFTSNQGVMTTLAQQRAAYDHTQLTTLSWASQKNAIFHVAAINDLMASDAVHLEIANEIATIIQNVSKVATALYIRVSATKPIERLEWAEYLRGAGKSGSLRVLSVLPGWNNQDYIDRQQMQMLVDWLFTQVDPSIPAAAGYMSDMARTAILLASHAPVSDVIAGEVAARTKPAVGALVPLTSPSSRVVHGMPVLLYQGSELMARAVVDDLDAQQVYAKVTTVYKNDFLEQNAQAHFLNDDPTGTLLVKSTLMLR